MSTTRVIAAVSAAAAAALVLAGCVPNNPAGEALSVAISDTACDVSAATAAAGTIN